LDENGALPIIVLAAMSTPSEEWEEVALGPVRLRSPVPLTQSDATGIDSTAARWEGGSVDVTIDEGALADPLTSYEDRPGARVSDRTIGGRSARVVSMPLEDGRHLAAAHFEAQGEMSEGFTISVVGSEQVGEEVPLQMVESVELV